MPFDIEPFSPLAGPASGTGGTPARDTVVVGLVNNMPDTALEATEAQFGRLLAGAAGSLPVRLRLTSLPQVPRAGAGLERVNSGAYWPIEALLREPVDALIVTGAEPCTPRLRDEPYWERLREVLDWADANTTSSIWSCLAAHAAAEMLDGIQRRRLEHKRCGIYAHQTLPDQPLLAGLGGSLRTPHSRWNELPVEALRAAGYTLASASNENGADVCTRQGRSLLVFFQGHPEYEDTTLLKEYRRDVGRFLRGQQAAYPTLPHGYFPHAALDLLEEFAARAQAAPDPQLLAEFPMAALAAGLTNSWNEAALRIYRNWLAMLAAAKSITPHSSPKVSESLS